MRFFMYMSYEYMVELHKFLYQSNDSDIERLRSMVVAHLKYIPHKKLYRYRKFNDDEIQTLSRNSIWLSNPEKFPDMFDATIPLEDKKNIDWKYPFYFNLEVAYIALVKTAEKGEKIPDKSEFFEAIYKIIEEYTPEEIHEEATKIRREAGCKELQEWPVNIDFSYHTEQAKKFLENLSGSPRKLLTIASFTTRYDNRNMWENYAERYTGFCVEYNFSQETMTLSSKSAWDVLHLLPVRYFKRKPLFNYNDILQSIVREDMKIEEFHIDSDSFLTQYYQSITAKLYDYRAEQEWRLIMGCEQYGEYSFPYTSKIFIGKDMPDTNKNQICQIADKLNISVYKQVISDDGNEFEYIKI